MSKALLTYVDRVVDASMAPASRALAHVVNDVREALEGADGYEAADAALRRLEGKARADRLEGVLVGAMMNGTSAGSAG